MLSNHASDLLTAIKSKPNNENRNRAISHLNDCIAHLKVMEFNESKKLEQSIVADVNMQEIEKKAGCICSHDSMDALCPVHGFSV